VHAPEEEAHQRTGTSRALYKDRAASRGDNRENADRSYVNGSPWSLDARQRYEMRRPAREIVDLDQ
jgi:hypothetical protein